METMMKPSGQTINFATKPVCPECGGEIPANEIAVEKDSGQEKRVLAARVFNHLRFGKLANTFFQKRAHRPASVRGGFRNIVRNSDSLGNLPLARRTLPLLFFWHWLYCCHVALGNLDVVLHSKRVEAPHGFPIQSRALLLHRPADLL